MPEKKRRLIEAAVRRMLRYGYAATSVEEICAEAGVTKGSFFHYFASKEEISRAAMDAWAGGWLQILEAARFDAIPDPLDRLERLFDVMAETYLTPEVDPGCMIGTVGQETALANPGLGEQVAAHFDTWTEGVRRMLADAKAAHPPAVDFDPASVADFLLGIVQGTLLVAKTRPDRAVVRNNVAHCRAYVLGLFGRAPAGAARP
mgnify:FL=1|jgi:Transcriptional regulator